MKATVIYHSTTGNVHQLGRAAVEHATALGMDASGHRLPEIDDVEGTRAAHSEALADLREARIVLWGTPGRYGSMSGPMRHFLDQTLPLHTEGLLADKYMSTFVSTATNHGGQESTILSFNNVFYHWGSIIIPAGAAGAAQRDPLNGNPYGISSVSHRRPDAVATPNLDAMRELVDRMYRLATQVNSGSPVTPGTTGQE